MRARRLGLLLPSSGTVQEGLEADGLTVPVASGLGLTDSLEIAAVPPEAIARFAVETFRRGPADAVFVACCTFRAFEARDTIATAIGVPVVTSNQAALDAALRVLDGGGGEAARKGGRAGTTLRDSAPQGCWKQ